MNLKKSPFAIQDKNARDLDNAKDYPTIADIMREQKVKVWLNWKDFARLCY